ncbi:MAG: sporulation protein YabP [Bacillota bacterium]
MNMGQEQHSHRIIVINREQASVEGVIHVDSFDDREVILETDLGMMSIQGEDLHIKQLSLEEGLLSIEGVVKTVDYLEDGLIGSARGKRKSIFDRLFK